MVRAGVEDSLPRSVCETNQWFYTTSRLTNIRENKTRKKMMLVFFVLKHLAPSFYCYYCYYYSHFYCFFYFFYFYCYFMLLLLVIVQRAAFSTGCYQRANIFTTDRGRPSFARGNYGEQIILSATHIIMDLGVSVGDHFIQLYTQLLSVFGWFIHAPVLFSAWKTIFRFVFTRNIVSLGDHSGFQKC